MTDDRTTGTLEQGSPGPAAPKPNSGLRQLDRLVGTWELSGDAEGRLSYEWMEGGFFLIARGDGVQGGNTIKHIEIIGYEHAPGREPADVLTSRIYTNRGDTLDYTHELTDKTLTSWLGPKGSPAVFRATWSEDGNTLTGAWEWPGGGYSQTLTRISG